jgi:hypothetical protein
MATLTIGRYITTRTVDHHKESKAGFFARMANMLWRVSCGFSFSGLLLPVEPAFRNSNALSIKEKTEIDAYLMGF